jgi:NPCBM/NEW2 domain
MADEGSNRRGWVEIGGTVVPNWLTVIISLLALSGAGAGVHAIASTSTSTGQPKQEHPTTTAPTTPLFLDAAGPSDTKPGSNTSLATGLASISGAQYKHSVRQLYNANCCGDEESDTYAIPEGYTRFEASIGLETGNGYEESGAPAMIFEVALGGPANRVYEQQMRYGEPPRRVTIQLSGQSSIVLQSHSDASKCFTCSTDAVWGNARLVP